MAGRIASRRGLAGVVALVVAYAGAPGGAGADTALPNRPSEPAGIETIERLRTLADQVGWGSLRETEHMKLADTVYGEGPVIAVTAAPYLPVVFFLESRHWAAQRLLGVPEADDRLAEIFVDPSDALVFDVLVIVETPDVLADPAPRVAYRDDTGRTLPADALALEVTEEPTMGGALHAGRGRVRVALPETFEWSTVNSFTLEFTTGATAYLLEWTFES